VLGKIFSYRTKLRIIKAVVISIILLVSRFCDMMKITDNKDIT